MTALLAAVHIPDLNGIPKDDTINTFAFDVPGASVSGMTDVLDVQLPAFYNTVPTGSVGTFSLSGYMASNLDRGANKCHVVYYVLSPVGGTAHVPVLPLGAPVHVLPFTLRQLAQGTGDLPRECAAVLSYHSSLTGLAEDTPGGVAGPRGDAHPAARHRGRIYLGPLSNNSLGAGTNGPGLSDNLRDVATKAAKQFLITAASTALEGLAWSVWSRTNNLLTPIIAGWMDDAFDTQRRRGILASVRTAFSI